MAYAEEDRISIVEEMTQTKIQGWERSWSHTEKTAHFLLYIYHWSGTVSILGGEVSSEPGDLKQKLK